MTTAPAEPPPQRTNRVPGLLVTLIVVAAVVGIAYFVLSRGASTTPSGSPSSAVIEATAVPTLDFFRGKSYPTPTTQANP